MKDILEKFEHQICGDCLNKIQEYVLFDALRYDRYLSKTKTIAKNELEPLQIVRRIISKTFPELQTAETN